MKVRKIDLDKEFDLVKKFYPEPIRKDDLPEGSTFVVEKDGVLTACGALMLTNAKVAWMEFLATNHELSEVTQARSLTILATRLRDLAKFLKYKSVMGFVPEDHFSLADFYSRQGAVQYKKLARVFVQHF